MKVRFLLLLSILFVSTITGCKKDPTNEDSNENGETPENPLHFEEDLSFTRTLKQFYYRNSRDSVLKIYEYVDNKQMLYEFYRNGVLQTQWGDFVYDGLTCVYTVTNSVSQVEAYSEYLDDSYSRTIYGETRASDGIASRVYQEYDGKKCIGSKRYSYETLTQETKDFVWDGLNCSYTTYIYNSEPGVVTDINEYSYTYLDDTYKRPTHTILRSVSYTYGLTSVTETFYQYDGKKPVGKQEYRDGILREEYKDYVYDGNKCTFKQLLYGNNGELVFEGEAYTIYYNS